MEAKILSADVKLSFSSKTTVQLDEDVEITFNPRGRNGLYQFMVEDIKGDIDILGINFIDKNGRRGYISFNNDTKSFYCGDRANAGFEIQFCLDIVETKVAYFEQIYHFSFSANLLIILKLHEYYEDKIELDAIRIFPYTIKKVGDKTKLYEIMSSNKYSDVILISSDKIEIPSHRSILSIYSKVFDTIFETSENPAKIYVEEFNAETIQAALDFMCDKHDAIIAKEMNVFKFAVKFEIQELIDACCSFFKESVDPTNVCEYIQIAFSNNFEELKQKCKQIMVENKAEIEFTNLADLSKDILLCVYCL
uniref:BTB domain-containing protein n=1 Tax=Panagrolaimus sp. ES5 TaxID=591445 RepID=A0AC34G5Y5_9BILA